MHTLLLLALLGGGAAHTPTWVLPPAEYDGTCFRMTSVFDVKVCLTEKAWAEGDAGRALEYNHVANVLAQVMDNDEDGVVDDAALQARMKSDNSVLVVPAKCSEVDLRYSRKPAGRYVQVCLEHVHRKTCDVPTNRGAAANNPSDRRAAWEPHRLVTNTTAGVDCVNERDRAFEGVLGLFTFAAARVYPEVWGLTGTSDLRSALAKANGDCGHASSGNYRAPTGSCGAFATSEATCRECNGCVAAKGLYYALATYLGAMYTKTRYDDLKGEWIMNTPDTGMAAAGGSVFQTDAAELYELVKPTSQSARMWLPQVLPTGAYRAGQLTAVAAFPVPVNNALTDITGLTLAAAADVDEEAPCRVVADDDDGGIEAGVIVVICLGVFLVAAVIGGYVYSRKQAAAAAAAEEEAATEPAA